jgi:hypothetical protein
MRYPVGLSLKDTGHWPTTLASLFTSFPFRLTFCALEPNTELATTLPACLDRDKAGLNFCKSNEKKRLTTHATKCDQKFG